MENIKRRDFIKIGVGATAGIALSNFLSFCTNKNGSSSINRINKDKFQEILLSARDIYHSSPDGICLERARLLTEAYKLFKDDPTPILRAKALNHIMQNMTLDLDTNPVFAGNLSSAPRKWMLLPENHFSVPKQAIIEDNKLEGHLSGDKIPKDIREFWNNKSGNYPRGHLCIQNDILLKKGLDGIIAEADKPSSDPEVSTYRKASAISAQAVIDWASRYADEAEKKALSETDQDKKILFENIATSCRHIPAKPARNMHEAIQSILLVQYAMHLEGHGYSVSPGRLDQILHPYYNEDENTTELLAAFFVKLYGNDLWGSHSKTQAITLGGCNEKGECNCNELTSLFLDAMEMAKVNDPNVFLRWHSNMSDEIKQKAISILMKGHSMPMIIGDEETSKGLINKGVSVEDAWNYVIVGCNEVGIPGKMIFVNAGIPELKTFRKVVLDSKSDTFTTIDEFIEETAKLCKEKLIKGIPKLKGTLKARSEVYPTPLTSSLMYGCLEKGEDIYKGIHYNFYNILSIGFSNMINAMTAVQEVILNSKKYNNYDLRKALDKNFEQYQGLRKELSNAPKWGNDNDIADNIALKWLKARHTLVLDLENEFNIPLLEELVTRSLHHLFGRSIKATPDGRSNYEALSDSVGAQQGFYKEGPTALLNSVAKMEPSVNWPGGYNLNIAFPLMKSQDENIVNKVTLMLDVFFENGGQEIQINALSEDILQDAIDNPEKYPYLIVRIAGFNGYFTKLSKTEQQEIINRARSCSLI